MADATQAKKESLINRLTNRFGQAFKERGIEVSDLPTAVIIHEVLGMVMALGFWSLCYGIQPTKTLAKPVTRLFNMVPPGAGSSNRQLAAAQRAYTLAMAQATNTVSKMSWIRSQQTAAGLTTALAESLMLRATIKPATFVFKIWASAELLLLFKGMMQTMQQNKKKASSTDTKKGDGKQNKKK